MLFDEQDRQVIKDPYDIICSVGLLSKQYAGARRGKKLALLRAKALSTLYQYPGCPVVAEMSKYLLRMTKHIDMRNVIEKNKSYSQWERDRYFDALKGHLYDSEFVIGMGTRMLFAELYGMSVETQIRLENHFRSLVKLEPFRDVYIDYMIRYDDQTEHRRRWANYYELYSIEKKYVNNVNTIHFDIGQIS